MREISTVTYDPAKFADENLLYRNKLIDPVELDINMTFMYGTDSDMFPLLTKTMGEGLITSKTPKQLNDTTFTWKVFGRMKHTSECAGAIGSITLGVGGGSFRIKMKDGMFIKQYGAMSLNGDYRLRIQTEHGRQSDGFWHYTVSATGSSAISGIPIAQFAAGKYWVLSVPTIPASKSDGNRDNTMLPGEWTSQFGYHRYSKGLAGNVSNMATNIQLPLDGGGTTNQWMPYDMKRFELDRRLLEESNLWLGEYNRDENGRITTIDDETGEPVPMAPGVKEILNEVGNYSTYSSLTTSVIDGTMMAVLDNRVDSTPDEIILYTGAGGIREFNNALMLASANGSTYFEALGSAMIQDNGGSLTYGKYFNAYKTISGKIVRVIESKFFNHGPLAELDRAAGNMINGYPAFSYNLVSLDHSATDNGGRNISLVAAKGREHQVGIYKGMSPLPAVWGAMPNQMISTRKDIAYYEIITSKGIVFTNPTTSFWLSRAA